MPGFAATPVTLYCLSQNNDVYAFGLWGKHLKITNIDLSINGFELALMRMNECLYRTDYAPKNTCERDCCASG